MFAMVQKGYIANIEMKVVLLLSTRFAANNDDK